MLREFLQIIILMKKLNTSVLIVWNLQRRLPVYTPLNETLSNMGMAWGQGYMLHMPGLNNYYPLNSAISSTTETWIDF